MTTTVTGRSEYRSIYRTNPTTKTGKVVHAPGHGPLRFYPACGQYIHGIVYTSEPINCARCIAAKEEL